MHPLISCDPFTALSYLLVRLTPFIVTTPRLIMTTPFSCPCMPSTAREAEWGELAETILLSVNGEICFIEKFLPCFAGSEGLCAGVPDLHHPPTPTEQRRYLKGHPTPHISSAQQFLCSPICRAAVLRVPECDSCQLSPICGFSSRSS